MTAQEKIDVATSEVLGQQAFVNGIKSAPVLDKEVMKLVGKYSTSDFSKSNVIQSILKQWSLGWHNANLAGDF